MVVQACRHPELALVDEIAQMQQAIRKTDGKRTGPFAKIEFFYLDFTKRFGAAVVKDGRVQLMVGERVVDLPLNDFTAPVRITRSQLTAAIVGTQTVRNKSEIWVRAVPLE